MTQTQILGLIMYRTGMRVDEWAQKNGFAKSTVYRVISREMKRGKSTDKVRKAISATVRKDLLELWPEAAKTQ